MLCLLSIEKEQANSQERDETRSLRSSSHLLFGLNLLLPHFSIHFDSQSHRNVVGVEPHVDVWFVCVNVNAIVVLLQGPRAIVELFGHHRFDHAFDFVLGSDHDSWAEDIHCVCCFRSLLPFFRYSLYWRSLSILTLHWAWLFFALDLSLFSNFTQAWLMVLLSFSLKLSYLLGCLSTELDCF